MTLAHKLAVECVSRFEGQRISAKKKGEFALEFFIGAYAAISKLPKKDVSNSDMENIAFNVHIISIRGYSWVKELAEKANADQEMV